MSSHPKHPSINMIKKDMVQKRAQRFEQGSAYIPEEEEEVTPSPPVDRLKHPAPRKSPARPLTNPPPPPLAGKALQSQATAYEHVAESTHLLPGSHTCSHIPGCASCHVCQDSAPGGQFAPDSQAGLSIHPGSLDHKYDKTGAETPSGRPKMPAGPKPKLEHKPASGSSQQPETKNKHQQALAAVPARAVPATAGAATCTGQVQAQPRTSTLIADKARIFQGTTAETSADSNAGVTGVDGKCQDTHTDRQSSHGNVCSTKPTGKVKQFPEGTCISANTGQDSVSPRIIEKTDSNVPSSDLKETESRLNMRPPLAPGHHSTYAKANKVASRRERRRSRSRSRSRSPEIHSTPAAPGTTTDFQAYDGVLVVPNVEHDRVAVNMSTPLPPTSHPAPPKKPPRTFEHDHYMKQKQQRKKKKVPTATLR